MRYMNHCRWLILLIVGMSIIKLAHSQNTMYFQQSIPQRTLLNPAFTSTCNYIGIPVLSSFYFNYDNTAFAYNELFPEQDGSRVPDIGMLTKNMHNLDLFHIQLNTNLFSLGLNYKEYYFHFNIAEKIGFKVTANRGFMDLVWEGNSQFAGQTFQTDRIGFQYEYYREYSLSAAKWLDDRWKVGVRAKLLFGKLNLMTRKEDLTLRTGTDMYNLDISASYLVNGSFPVDLQNNANGKVTSVSMQSIDAKSLLLNGKNPGFGVDVGAVYQYTEDIRFYGSLIDIGFIRWRDNLNNVEVDQQFRYRGISQEDIESDFNVQEFVDSVRDSWRTNTYSEAYSSALTGKIYAGATYSLNPQMQLGAVTKTLLYRRRFYPSLTLSYNARLFDFLAVGASYSYRNYAFNNIGAAIALQSKTMQFYMATDNLLAIKPLNTRNINVRFGINFFFNCRERSTDKDQPAVQGRADCFWIERERQQERIKSPRK